MRIQWIEEYNCGCSQVEDRKKDLLGYCGIHGNERKRVTKMPVPKGKKPLEKGLAS